MCRSRCCLHVCFSWKSLEISRNHVSKFLEIVVLSVPHTRELVRCEREHASRPGRGGCGFSCSDACPLPFSFFGVFFSAGQSRSFRSASSTACARKKIEEHRQNCGEIRKTLLASIQRTLRKSFENLIPTHQSAGHFLARILASPAPVCAPSSCISPSIAWTPGPHSTGCASVIRVSVSGATTPLRTVVFSRI